ncbi:MAG: capsule biosynthesis protein [Alphaproteobacteria bacterium]|nr:capsule biosynthesis protein [Alphaproteobacteria bacterium]
MALPVLVAAIYYFGIAADQYTAEFRLNLRTVDIPRVEPLIVLGSDMSHGGGAAESQIVAQYIASRAIVDELDPALDLRRMFAGPPADFWARLALPASIEDLVYFWKRQIDGFYDTSTGAIVVHVRAFTAEDALRLAQAIVAASERLINELSARARRDSVGQAEAELAAAEGRLKASLAAIREFRDREGLIDPGKAADATATLATKLRDDWLKANAELATLKAYMHDDAPGVRVIKARIRSLEAQQRSLAREMTGASPMAGAAAAPALSQTLGSYEPLDAERRFAEAAYQHALQGLDRARENADRQHVYIESFVPPSLPQTALYPRRWRDVGAVALVALAVWAIGLLALQSIREHL